MLYHVTLCYGALPNVVLCYVMLLLGSLLRDWHVSWHTKYNKQGKRTKKPHTRLVRVRCPVLRGYVSSRNNNEHSLRWVGGRG